LDNAIKKAHLVNNVNYFPIYVVNTQGDVFPLVSFSRFAYLLDCEGEGLLTGRAYIVIGGWRGKGTRRSFHGNFSLLFITLVNYMEITGLK